ncbi:hypothetical protein CLV30_11452 [Haloactinopolyspora alba]|uniref:Uncharacterized protein n=1 Tax=Haloactinopolyspora alba TaxID=648780 RepID=A0A2P8DVS8_9ACTN|nr:hypothetical protein CLV30_11452 [Haloactinopolyspora alba]
MTASVHAEVKQVLYFWPHLQEAPAGAAHFGVQAQIFIGMVGADEVDSFDVLVCSPSWLASRHLLGTGSCSLVARSGA